MNRPAECTSDAAYDVPDRCMPPITSTGGEAEKSLMSSLRAAEVPRTRARKFAARWAGSSKRSVQPYPWRAASQENQHPKVILAQPPRFKPVGFLRTACQAGRGATGANVVPCRSFSDTTGSPLSGQAIAIVGSFQRMHRSAAGA